MNLFDLNLTLPISDPTWVFFLVLIIILFAPMILGRLHIPHIIGMILAGVLIGEHGFHVLDRDSSFELFGSVAARGQCPDPFLAKYQTQHPHCVRCHGHRYRSADGYCAGS